MFICCGCLGCVFILILIGCWFLFDFFFLYCWVGVLLGDFFFLLFVVFIGFWFRYFCFFCSRFFVSLGFVDFFFWLFFFFEGFFDIGFVVLYFNCFSCFWVRNIVGEKNISKRMKYFLMFVLDKYLNILILWYKFI